MKYVRWVGPVALLVLFLYGRMIYESREQYQRGKEQQRQGQVEEAILSFYRSIHRYAPGNRYILRSLEELWTLGQSLEKNDPKTALFSYDAMRGGIYSIRSFYSPYKDWLPKVNERIATLRAAEQVKEQRTMTYAQAYAFHTKALQIDERPRTGWALLVQLGFWGWILSTVGWIWKGFDREGRMRIQPALPWICALTGFFALWVVGLIRA